MKKGVLLVVLTIGLSLNAQELKKVFTCIQYAD
jgi:hypothetical protein